MLDQHILDWMKANLFFKMVKGFGEWFLANREEIGKEFAKVSPFINARFQEGNTEDDMDLMDYALETYLDKE